MKSTNVHPAVTALETVMAELSSLLQGIDQGSRWAQQQKDEVDPTRWTKRIEEALNKPEELERLRVLYDEKALGTMSSWLRQKVYWEKLWRTRMLLSETIEQALAAYDAIDDKSADKWLKDIIQARCVEAMELHGTDHEDGRMDEYSGTFSRAHGILVTAFTALHQHISRLSGPCRAYTTDLVVPGRKYESFLRPDVDLRSSWFVDFVDCQNSEHPANRKLAELIGQLESRLAAARKAASRLKGDMNQFDQSFSKINNGTINERQHANRLLDVLHGEQQYCCPTEKLVAEQNERRHQYEGVRQDLLIAIKQLKSLYEEICQEIYAAVKETQTLLAEVQADKHTTIDRWLTLRLSMNNCLAVDLRLRSLGRELNELETLYHRDLSQGAGQERLHSKFADVERRYRPIKSRLPSESSAE